MLFKFRSKACADLIMLEADARRILKAMTGDDPERGIVRAADMPQALARLQDAVALDESQRHARAAADEPDTPVPDPIGLAQRAAPMQQMLRRCMAQEADLVWGV